MKRLILLSLMLALLSACSPYDDGPGLSLRTKKGRLTGSWKLTDLIGGSPDGRIWTFEGNGSYTEEQGSYFENGTWEFRDQKADLVILEDDGDRFEFEILRLSNAELWLMKVSSGDEWRFEKQ